jgi:hypothetical protein
MQPICTPMLAKFYSCKKWVLQKEGERKNLSAISKSVSKSQMPNLSDKNKRAGENLVMITTKSEMRDVTNKSSQVLIVLLYKDNASG